MRAIYRGREANADETVFMFHWDYLNESLKKTAPTRADQVGFYMMASGPRTAVSISET
jgi:putative ABC transport system permease protein